MRYLVMVYAIVLASSCRYEFNYLGGAGDAAVDPAAIDGAAPRADGLASGPDSSPGGLDASDQLFCDPANPDLIGCYPFEGTTSDGSGLGLDLDECSLAVIRDERYKYVHFAGLPSLLFDLVEDPDELHDLSRDSNYQAVRVEMAEKLLAWRSRYLDRRLTGISLTAEGPVDVRL